MAGEKERGKISLKSIISVNPMSDNLSFEFETFDKLRVLRAQSKRGTKPANSTLLTLLILVALLTLFILLTQANLPTILTVMTLLVLFDIVTVINDPHPF
jgi:uncharacterized membrane protein